MKIYVGHASSFNYVEDLYEPLKRSDLWGSYEFILPHESNREPVKSKKIIERSNAFIAEVTHPSTGLGIELGWANALNCPIYCFAKAGSRPSSSVNVVCSKIAWYEDQESLVSGLREWLVDVLK